MKYSPVKPFPDAGGVAEVQVRTVVRVVDHVCNTFRGFCFNYLADFSMCKKLYDMLTISFLLNLDFQFCYVQDLPSVKNSNIIVSQAYL